MWWLHALKPPHCGNTIYSSCWEFNYASRLHFWWPHGLLAHDPLSSTPSSGHRTRHSSQCSSQWTFPILPSSVPQAIWPPPQLHPWPVFLNWGSAVGAATETQGRGVEVGVFTVLVSPPEVTATWLCPFTKRKVMAPVRRPFLLRSVFSLPKESLPFKPGGGHHAYPPRLD